MFTLWEYGISFCSYFVGNGESFVMSYRLLSTDHKCMSDSRLLLLGNISFCLHNSTSRTKSDTSSGRISFRRNAYGINKLTHSPCKIWSKAFHSLIDSFVDPVRRPPDVRQSQHCVSFPYGRRKGKSQPVLVWSIHTGGISYWLHNCFPSR